MLNRFAKQIRQGTWVLRGAVGLGLALAVSSINGASLPDTGQDLCYDGSAMVACTIANSGDASGWPGQDGRFGRDAAAATGELGKIGAGAKGFDYTALDAAGNPTSPSSGATPHPCVRDNLTGLVWEVKTDDGGLHDKDWSYTWYNPDGNSNGGNAGGTGSDTCGGTLGANCNTQAFVDTVNAAGWCNRTNWRVPSRRELRSLINYGAFSPAIDTTHFPNAVTSYPYWSFSTYVGATGYAWRVAAFDGSVDYSAKIMSAQPLRLVSGTLF